MRSTTGSVTCAACVLTLLPLNALAEDAGRRDDQVLVTAQRRQEAAQDVPVSVSVVRGDALGSGEIHSISQMSAVVPGLVTTSPMNYGTAPLSLRGVGGANGGGNIFADEPVALYVNDAFINKVWATTTELVDIGSVQVLRGPQGTLYGRNSSAGAVLITTAAPTEQFAGYVRGSFTTLDEVHAQAALSGPLGADFLGRVAVGYVDERGWARNEVNGTHLGSGRQDTARLSLRWNASDATTADLVFGHQSSDTRPVSFAAADLSQLANPAPPNLVTPGQRRADYRAVLDGDTFEYGSPTETRIRSTSSTLNVRHRFGSHTLTSISAWQRAKISGEQDSDATALSVIENSGSEQDEDWSQELRFESDTGGRLRWLTGVYFSKQSSEVDAFTVRNQFSFLGAGTAARFDPQQHSSTWAAFSDGTLRLTDRMSLTLGGRFSHESKRFENHFVATTLRPVTAPAGLLGPRAVPVPAGTAVSGPVDVEYSKSWQDFSPRAVLSARFAERLLGYLSYSEGFKSGGFNAFGTSPAFDPEHVEAIELGLKASLPDRRVTLNSSVFHYDYSNLQVRLPVPTGGIDIRNAAKAEVTGVELEASAPIFRTFVAHAGVAWLDAHFREGSLPAVPQTFAFGSPTPLLNEDIAGNRLSRAPRWQFSAGVEYSRPIEGFSRFFASALFRRQSEVWFLETNQLSDTYRGGAWSRVDFRLGLAGREGRWELALAGLNLTDERHVAQVAAFSALPIASVEEPWSWALQVRFNLNESQGKSEELL